MSIKVKKIIIFIIKSALKSYVTKQLLPLPWNIIPLPTLILHGFEVFIFSKSIDIIGIKIVGEKQPVPVPPTLPPDEEPLNFIWSIWSIGDEISLEDLQDII